MEVRAIHEPWRFLEETAPLLLEDEARHNLVLGIAGTLASAPEVHPEFFLWVVREFWVEAVGEAGAATTEETVDRRLRGRGGRYVLWEDGDPVSLAGYGGATPNGMRIGPVYTPPELRGRGYASALVGEISAKLIGEGQRFCFLYTDLSNPTSNRLYQRLGYERVCDSAEYRFEA